MFVRRNLIQISSLIREELAGRCNDIIKVVVVTYCRISGNLRVYFIEDIDLANRPFVKELILVCYYAPSGDWKKWYGDEWRWDLSPKRIALDIKNNTLLYKRHYTVNGMEDLPNWLKTEIKNYL